VRQWRAFHVRGLRVASNPFPRVLPPGQPPLHLEDFDLAAELPERVSALGVMDSPAPISPISGALSKISTSSPALRSSMPAASPAMQAPAISVSTFGAVA
jgi:hypothetical protein